MDMKQRRALARKLRKMADELDPPASEIPPPLDAVAAYCEERGKGVDPEAFMDFYESKGWLVGKVIMKDWRAAVRNAERGGYFRRSDTNGQQHISRQQQQQQSSLAAIASAAGLCSGTGTSVPDETTGNIHNGAGGLLDFDSADVRTSDR